MLHDLLCLARKAVMKPIFRMARPSAGLIHCATRLAAGAVLLAINAGNALAATAQPASPRPGAAGSHSSRARPISGTDAPARTVSKTRVTSAQSQDYAYVADARTGYILEYAIRPNGALTPLYPGKVRVGPNLKAVACAPGKNTLYTLLYPSPYRNRVAAPGTYGFVRPFRVRSDGQLERSAIQRGDQTSVQADCAVSSTWTPTIGVLDASAVTSGGGHIVFSADGAVGQFRIQPDGALARMWIGQTQGGPGDWMATDAARHLVYAAAQADGPILQYRQDPTTHKLTPLTPPSVPAGHSPASIVTDPTGRFVYAAPASYERGPRETDRRAGPRR